MSLFDLQDVCIAIGSLATLDLPMVVDLIGIYGLKGLYSLGRRPPSSPKAVAVVRCRRRLSSPETVPANLDEENPSAPISSGLLVQADEGISFLVVDRIGDIYRNLPRRAVRCRRRLSSPETVPANLDEENPSAPISSGLLVQADEGVSYLVVDRIDVVYRHLP
ncbi:TMV resistance protein N-like [Dorcoceras hygrometricum]|uniref:TMV resistance protein N-like n=1 Tax=Dorcoceras hygrometricum TaxID=472368 RepID=A0A2Z7BU02_9LAMI|nr:TMV resistance protein N-like [Dorcoceras hygrometricum]